MTERNPHGCEAAVVECIDYRLRNHIDKWLNDEFKEKGKEFDLISHAGSTKDLDAVSNQIDISAKLHHIHQLVLIHHEDCGAYGNESTPEKHAEDLLKAKSVILQKHPEFQVNLYYLKLDGTFTEVA